MKSRRFFVSNSSTSSYVIVQKAPMTDAEVRNALMRMFNIAHGSVLYGVAQTLADVLVDNIEERHASTEDYLASAWEYGYDSLSEEQRLHLDMIAGGCVVTHGSVINEGEPEEYLLVELELDYEDEEIIVRKEAGY